MRKSKVMIFGGQGIGCVVRRAIFVFRRGGASVSERRRVRVSENRFGRRRGSGADLWGGRRVRQRGFDECLPLAGRSRKSLLAVLR